MLQLFNTPHALGGADLPQCCQLVKYSILFIFSSLQQSSPQIGWLSCPLLVLIVSFWVLTLRKVAPPGFLSSQTSLGWVFSFRISLVCHTGVLTATDSSDSFRKKNWFWGSNVISKLVPPDQSLWQTRFFVTNQLVALSLVIRPPNLAMQVFYTLTETFIFFSFVR